MTEILRLTPAEILALDVETEAEARRRGERLKPGTHSAGGTAVTGLDGHYFIGQGSNQWERQYVGRIPAHERWLETWTGLFAARQEEARRRGVALWNIVVPEKQVILPEARWSQPPPADGRPFAHLASRLIPEHRVLYPAAQLIAAKARGPAYFLRNSHWTPSGCLAAVAGLLAAMSPDVDVATTRFAYRQVRGTHDLPLHFFDPPRKVRAGILMENGPFLFEERPFETTGHYPGTRYAIRNADAPDRRRLLIFGDSFSYDAGLATALSAVFGEVVFIWGKHLDWSVVEAQRADLVLWESAERFLVTLPST